MNAKNRARLIRLAVRAGTAVSMSVLILVVGYILIMGVPNLKAELFAWKYNSENVSMMPAIIGTLLMTALSIALAVPFGVGAAIYLTGGGEGAYSAVFVSPIQKKSRLFLTALF